METPEELVEAGYQRHRKSLASDLLAKIKGCSPAFFERLVVDLLVAMGYGGSRQDAAQAVGQSGDQGVDGIIKEDRLGLDAVYVQAKRWENTVGRPVVQAFAGSLQGQRARKGVLITTSDFSSEARDYTTRIEKRIVLVRGAQLADLMIEHGIGVADVATYTLRRLDSDYFEEGEWRQTPGTPTSPSTQSRATQAAASGNSGTVTTGNVSPSASDPVASAQGNSGDEGRSRGLSTRRWGFGGTVADLHGTCWLSSGRAPNHVRVGGRSDLLRSGQTS